MSHTPSLSHRQTERECVFLCVWAGSRYCCISLGRLRPCTSLRCVLCAYVCAREAKDVKIRERVRKRNIYEATKTTIKDEREERLSEGVIKDATTQREWERELVTYQEATIIHTLREAQGLYHRVYSSDKTHTSVTKSKGFSEKLSIRVSCTPIFSYSLTCFVLPTRYIFKIGSWPSAFEGNYHLFFFTNITRLNSTSTDIAGRLDWGCDRDASPTQNDSVRMRLNHHYLSGVLTNSSNKSCCFYL